MASRLPRVARRHDATHHAGRVRRDESLIHRHEGRLALLLRVAGERDARCSSGACGSPGGEPQRLTPASARGNHDYDIGPNARFAIHTASSWGIAAGHRSRASAVARRRPHARRQPRAQVEARGSREGTGGVRAGRHWRRREARRWLMKPANFDSTKKYPMLLLRLRRARRSDRARCVRRQPLAVASRCSRSRATSSRASTIAARPARAGATGAKAVHNQIGSLRVREQSAAARVIGRRPYVDSTRMGVWGWSGGGSSTLLLMFRAPDVYKVGMSVAPVADVHNYDTIYQERYVGLPTHRLRGVLRRVGGQLRARAARRSARRPRLGR